MTAALFASPDLPAVPVAPAIAGLPRLLEYLRRMPDPRRPQGKRHPLEAILLLVGGGDARRTQEPTGHPRMGT